VGDLEKSQKIEGIEENEKLPNETLIQLLSNQTGVSAEEIKSIFVQSEGNIQKVIEIIKEVAPSYVAIKGKLQPRRKGELNGVFCLVARGVTGEILAYESWIGPKDLPEDFDVKATWESVYSYIISRKDVHDNYAKRQFDKIIDRLFPHTTLNKLFTSHINVEEVQRNITREIGDILRFDTVVEINVEKFNEIRYTLSPLGKKTEEEPDLEEKQQEEANVGFQSISLACVPRLDAVKGKPVADLQEGDMVEVAITSNNPLGKFMNRLFAKNDVNPKFKVKSLEQLPSGEYLVRLHISDDIEGIFKSSGELKVSVIADEKELPKRANYYVFVSIILFVVLFLYLVFRR